MNDDIIPSLLKEVQDKFEAAYGKSDIISSAFAKLKNKKATYATANDFAIELGDILAEALGSTVTGDKLPDGKMYYNIGQRLLNDVLGRNFELVSDFTGQVQTNLNKEANIGLKVQVPEFNQDRVDGLVNRLSSEDDFEKVSWLLKEPIVNFTQSIVDDAIRANAEFHAKTGMTPTISRQSTGKCCKWCNSLVGKYIYGEEPKGFYRRHQNCRCIIEYHPKNGKYQNSWSKKWTKETDDVLERRKQIGIDIRDNNRKADSAEYKKIVDTLGVDKSPISLAKFQNMKYNDGEEYNWLKREARFVNELATKDWSATFKQRSLDAFGQFKENGLSISTHAASRLPRLNNGKGVPITTDDVISLVKNQPNFVEGDDKVIYFDAEKQLAVIKNKETDDIVSIVRRKIKKEGWLDVPRNDE